MDLPVVQRTGKEEVLLQSQEMFTWSIRMRKTQKEIRSVEMEIFQSRKHATASKIDSGNGFPKRLIPCHKTNAHHGGGQKFHHVTGSGLNAYGN